MTGSLFWRRSTLSNGLRILEYPASSANTAQLSLAVEFGSNQEPAENAGIAHFLEHMLAGGSKQRIQLSRKIEASGGILDFYTDHEYMMSTMDVLPGKLAESSAVLAGLLFDNDFEEQKFEIEQKIILNELAEAADNPAEKIEEMLLGSLFKKHPVKRPVGGFPKTVKALALPQLDAMHQTNYVPANMVLVLSGNYNEKDAEAVRYNFTGKTGGCYPSKPSTLVEKQKPKGLVVKEKAGLTQSYLSVGARTVSSGHSDSTVLNLIGILLGGGTSSRLFVELRENNALTYDVNASHCKGLDYGYLSVNCAVNSKNLAKTQGLIKKEFAKLRTEKVPTDEMDKAKNMIVGGALRGIDSLEEAPDILTYMEIQFRNEKALVNYLTDVKSTTCEDIMRVANIYLQEDCFATAILNPKPNR